MKYFRELLAQTMMALIGNFIGTFIVMSWLGYNPFSLDWESKLALLLFSIAVLMAALPVYGLTKAIFSWMLQSRSVNIGSVMMVGFLQGILIHPGAPLVQFIGPMSGLKASNIGLLLVGGIYVLFVALVPIFIVAVFLRWKHTHFISRHRHNGQ